ncbi:MAG: hypothetical protein HFH72_02525 [Lachnospiraceae bacterium]|nr:hypothetical protein [Lachnospiraceae bacterium]
MSGSSIMLGNDAEGAFFYLKGDNMKYYDLGCLIFYHPEEAEYVQRHRFELEREKIQCNERLRGRR